MLSIVARVALCTAAAWCLGAAAQPLAYPKTAKVEHTDSYFGTQVADPYRWLEDDNSADTKAWVQAENKVTDAWFDGIGFRAPVRARVRALANYPKYSAPTERSGAIYFYKNDGLQNQSVLYVQKGVDAPAEVLLDPNTFSSDSTVRLTSFSPSKDGRYAAYSQTAIPGSDWNDIRILDLKTRKPLPEVLHWIKFSGAAWRGDGFFYSRFAEPAKGSELTVRTVNRKVYFHRVGTEQSADALVFEDPAHPDRFTSFATTEDERFTIRSSSEPGKRGDDLWVRDESKGETAFRPVVAEIGDERFDVIDNVGAELLVQTTRGAPNGRVVRIDPLRPAEKEWKEILAERGELLQRSSSAGGKLFVSYLKDVTSQIEVRSFDGALENRIELPGPGSAGGFSGEAGAREVFYVFTSLSLPPTIFRYDIASRKTTLFRAPEIPGYDANRFESRQVFFKSKDGTRVPMFLVYKKGLKLDGSNPTVLYGYGGFNISLTPSFSSSRIAWLEQGGVYAMANLRGGGEYGEAWHEAGMRLKKQNVFDDCIAAAEYLIGEGYTRPDRLALQGGSNGGLLVGAVVNQRPDLFKVALPQVGVMDMLRFQRFSVGKAWTTDYGSSDDEAQFKALLAYSPLHNIKPGAKYPATLITTSDHDDRVVPAHSFKYAATLQEKAGGGAPKLIRIETNSGHGASNLSKTLDETADSYTFIWANMGVSPKLPS